MSESLSAVGRATIAVTVVLTCLLYLPALADPVNVIKLTVLVLAALLLVFLFLLHSVRQRSLRVPAGPAAWALVALLLALLVATITAPSTTTAVVGTYGRNSGLLAYAAAIVLFVAGVRLWSGATAHWLALGLLAAGGLTAVYGLFQYAGHDFVSWNNPFNPIIGAMGNPDFASAYLGICVPVAAWGALWPRWPVGWRIASGVAGLLCLVAALLSKAVQGPMAAAAGLAVFAAALLLERGGTVARRGLLALGGLTAVGVVTIAAGAARLGPAAGIFRRGSYQARLYYWEGAVTMLRRHPLTGVGLDHFGDYWRQLRSVRALHGMGPNSYSDAAHSVPLQMFAQGGLLLGLTYVAFLVVVAVFLVRGLMRLEGADRLLLGAVGGAWLGYVVSSAVSIDQVPLITVEFATAAAVVALGGAASHEIRLPGALAAVPPSPQRRGQRQPVVRQRAVTGADAAMIGGAAVIVAVLAWFSLLPMRANAAVRRGDVALAQGRGNDALTAYQQANDLLAGEGVYWEKTGFLLETVKHPELALPVYLRGVRHDPLDPALMENAAQLAADAGRESVARDLWHRAAKLEPTNPSVIERAATFETTHGRPDAALSLLARPLALLPSDPRLWVATGAARAGTHDDAGARRAYAKALSLDPANEAAKAGIADLDRASSAPSS